MKMKTGVLYGVCIGFFNCGGSYIQNFVYENSPVLKLKNKNREE